MRVGGLDIAAAANLALKKAKERMLEATQEALGIDLPPGLLGG